MTSTGMQVPVLCIITLAVRTFSSSFFPLRGSIIQDPVARSLIVFFSCIMVHVPAGTTTVSFADTLHVHP